MFKYLMKKFCFTSCLLCKDTAQIALDLCQPCVKDLPYITYACQRCANPLPCEMNKNICITCVENGEEMPPYRIFPVFYYTKIIHRLIIRLQSGRSLAAAKILGILMADYMKKFYKNKKFPELIMPIPIHYQQLQSKGFNQALEIARSISQCLAIPVNFTSLVQSNSIQWKRKVGNNREVQLNFTVATGAPQHICLIDSIWNGYTAQALTRLLHNKDSAMNWVDVWCCTVRL